MYQYPPRQDGRVDENGNPLAATIADLTVEPVLKAGDVVEVPCDICEGDPGYRSPIGDPDKCWRCHGKSKVTLTVPEPTKCPGCKEDLTGEQISRKSMSCYGATHFGNEIGLYANDMTQAWMCPHCSCRWSRWDGRILDPEEPIEMLHRESEGTRYISGTGQVIGVHRKSDDCMEHTCCIHNPSDHEFIEWPTHYNWELGRMERVNPETDEHVHDPDDLAYQNRMAQEA